MSWDDERMIMDYAKLQTKIKNLDEVIVEIYAILENNQIDLNEAIQLFRVVSDVQSVKLMGFGGVYKKIDESKKCEVKQKTKTPWFI